jgi:hypothetical protein
VGVIGTAAIVPMGIHEYERRVTEYDQANPVVEGTGRIIRRDGDAVEIEVVARRLRGECTRGRVMAASEGPTGALTAIYASRLGDGPEDVSYPEGALILSQWRMWPVGDVRAVHLLGAYVCGGRPITATIARVELPK